MALHLITGYAGEEHITSADQGAYNMGTYGEGEFVLDRGNKFGATVVSNNSITIADGEAMMQGRYIRLAAGTTASVAIDNGSQGMNRKDLICLRYEKNSGTGVESVSFVVKKGTASSSTPSDPSYTTGTITDGTDLVNEMPLYRVNLSGLNISSLDSLFSVKTSMVEYMANYQLPTATASVKGGVKVGDGLQIASEILSVKKANRGTEYSLELQTPISVSTGFFNKTAVRLNYPNNTAKQRLLNADKITIFYGTASAGVCAFEPILYDNYIEVDFWGYATSAQSITSLKCTYYTR